eukprot:SAG31_NODE_4296_length_3374_cov_1.438473_3_plen_391_part_00
MFERHLENATIASARKSNYIAMETDGSPGGSRWVYSKIYTSAAASSESIACNGESALTSRRHLYIKIRCRWITPEANAALAAFGEVENIEITKGALFVTYKTHMAASSALAALPHDEKFSAAVGCGNRRGTSVHHCVARDLRKEAAVAVEPTPLPQGLVLHSDFIDATEEARLLHLIVASKPLGLCWSTNSGSRRVAHFGYTFDYHTRAIDFETKTQPLPEWTQWIVERVRQTCLCDPRFSDQVACWVAPDQLTINEYLPGQGIAPHVETHSAFLDVLFSISLGAAYDMDFRECRRSNATQASEMSGRSCSIQLPRRSLLVLHGEARYGWSHGIAARQTDPLAGQRDSRRRETRYSLTFRSVRPRGERCRCAFPFCCDSQAEAEIIERST